MARKPAAGNIVSIAAAIEAPVDAPLLGDVGGPDPDRFDNDRDAAERLDRPRLPPDCPVKALGINGQICWYLNVSGQLIAMGPRDHGKNNIQMLFTPYTGLPTKYWPRWSAPKVNAKTGEVTKASEIVGFAQDDASEALIGACGEAGIFEPLGRVRGPGAHPASGGRLVLHLGDTVLVSGARVDGSPAAGVYHPPGVIDRFVYPAAAETPRPAERASYGVGEALLHHLETWRWARPELDPYLALGFVGQGYLCGALRWRSHIFITGGAGTGKSTLNGKEGVFDRLFGRAALRTGNASEAAVRQLLASRTIPVIFDEFEANELNPGRTRAIVELARVASSGEEAHRGGQDHQAHSFALASAFAFSAIQMPQLKPQDRSRFAVLELEPFKAGGEQVDLDAWDLPRLGQQLQRRMIDGWARWPTTLKAYRQAFGRAGHTQRACDQYGTLLACADLLLYDEIPDPDLLAHWAKLTAPNVLREVSEAVADHDACLTHLTTKLVQASGSDERLPIGTWIAKAVDEARLTLLGTGERKYRDRLATQGLRIVNLRPTASGAIGAVDFRADAPGYLAVAASGDAIGALFRDTDWARGGWNTALGRTSAPVEGGGVEVVAVRVPKVKFGARGLSAVCVPLGLVLAGDDAADDAGARRGAA